MSHQGIVIVTALDAAKSTKYAHGSIPTQTADCAAMVEREGWIVDRTHRAEAWSAYDRSRDDGLAQDREQVLRRADEHGVATLAVQHIARLARGDEVRSATHDRVAAGEADAHATAGSRPQQQ